MIDIDKILDVVDSGKEVIIAREDKPLSIIMPFEKYQELKGDLIQNKDQKNKAFESKNGFEFRAREDDSYIAKIKRAVIEE